MHGHTCTGTTRSSIKMSIDLNIEASMHMHMRTYQLRSGIAMLKLHLPHVQMCGRFTCTYSRMRLRLELLEC
jgi:hypothetical protein